MIGGTIDFSDAAPGTGHPAAGRFERWAAATVAGFRLHARLGVRLVGEAESADLNGRFRARPRPTNVLSFPAEGLPGEWADYLGDLVICVPVVEREASEAGRDLEDHYAHLTVHGCLHLLGFDHTEEAAAERMESLEVEILARFGIDDPYLVS